MDTATTTLPTITVGQSDSLPSKSGIPSGKLSGGAVAGVVISVLATIVLAGFFLIIFLRRRRRKSMDISPDPLVVDPDPPRPNRSNFLRLPHFTAPPSIWPPTETPIESTVVRPSPVVRESPHGRVTPFELPTLATPALDPAPPPKHKKTRQSHRSLFFVANPSSHSGSSSRSRSWSQKYIRPTSAQVVRVSSREGKPDLLDDNVDEKDVEIQKDGIRVDKGKQRAIDSGQEFPAPSRPRMSRKQSFRRFFFTTNPSPSTASSSSTTSSKRRVSAKRAAVAEYVRNQMRQKPASGSHFDSSPLPPLVSVPESPARLAVSRERATPTRMPSVQEISPPTGKRQSKTLFFTANPNPSTYEVSGGLSDVSSPLSEIPQPRKDKGKQRAF